MTVDQASYERVYAIEIRADQTTDGGKCFLASHPELPGCMAHGATPEEAKANLAEARALYLQVLRDQGEAPSTLRAPTRQARAELVADKRLTAEFGMATGTITWKLVHYAPLPRQGS